MINSLSTMLLSLIFVYKGSATRFCMTSNSSEHGGKWAKPNLTECVSKEIQKIHDEVNS